MNAPLVWAGALVVLSVIAWAAVRVLREPSTPSEPKKKTSSSPPKVAAAPPAPVLPSIADDEEVEVTVVTAFPASERSGGDEIPVDQQIPTTETSEASRVEVTYEDDADIEEVTSPIARILVSASAQSDSGKVRRRNEDSFLDLPARSVFAVADGMGGYVGGDVASKLAVDTLRRSFEKNVFDGKTESSTTVPRRGREVACAVQMANQAILAKSHSDPELAGMGTTLVAARFSPNKQRVYIGHVGDSRCYRLRGETMRQLTNDHTLFGLGLRGPGSHSLYQALGVKPRVTIDIIVDKPCANDIYLLCSDGLTKMASPDQIKEVLLKESDLDAVALGLIELANDKGGKDNVTAILIKVLDHAPSASS